jgi:hypothetical protein
VDVLTRLSKSGVSIWLDDLSRQRLTDGSLARLVRDRHVVGVTTNPTIFARATTAEATWARAWARGLGTSLLNPKNGVFYMAMLPQFIPSGAPHLLMGSSWRPCMTWKGWSGSAR